MGPVEGGQQHESTAARTKAPRARKPVGDRWRQGVASVPFTHWRDGPEPDRERRVLHATGRRGAPVWWQSPRWAASGQWTGHAPVIGGKRRAGVLDTPRPLSRWTRPAQPYHCTRLWMRGPCNGGPTKLLKACGATRLAASRYLWRAVRPRMATFWRPSRKRCCSCTAEPASLRRLQERRTLQVREPTSPAECRALDQRGRKRWRPGCDAAVAAAARLAAPRRRRRPRRQRRAEGEADARAAPANAVAPPAPPSAGEQRDPLQAMREVDLAHELRRRGYTLQSPPGPMGGALKAALSAGLTEVQRDPSSAEGWKLFLLAPRMLLYRGPENRAHGGPAPAGAPAWLGATVFVLGLVWLERAHGRVLRPAVAAVPAGSGGAGPTASLAHSDAGSPRLPTAASKRGRPLPDVHCCGNAAALRARARPPALGGCSRRSAALRHSCGAASYGGRPAASHPEPVAQPQSQPQSAWAAGFPPSRQRPPHAEQQVHGLSLPLEPKSSVTKV